MQSIGLEPIYIDYKTTVLPIKPTQHIKYIIIRYNRTRTYIALSKNQPLYRFNYIPYIIYIY